MSKTQIIGIYFSKFKKLMDNIPTKFPKQEHYSPEKPEIEFLRKDFILHSVNNPAGPKRFPKIKEVYKIYLKVFWMM